jgi:hypothetical protein
VEIGMVDVTQFLVVDIHGRFVLKGLECDRKEELKFGKGLHCDA